MNTLLSPLPWHEELWAEVTTQAMQGRLAHALLLAGPRGVGKRHFAQALVAYLLCEQRAEYACGLCRGCQQYLAASHPNYLLMQPIVDEKTGKEKRDISVEQVRDFSEKLQLTSHYAQSKVALIDPADALNASGVNALLKTIEEPSRGTFMLLISERPMALAPTLRSRCQRLRFAVPASHSAMTWLKAEHQLTDADVLAQANGAPLRAIELHKSGVLATYREWERGMQDLAAQKSDPIGMAGKIGKEHASAFLTWLQQWLVSSLKLKLTHASGGSTQTLPSPAIEQLLRETLDGQRRLGGNLNPQMLIESLLILWWRLARTGKPA